MQCEVSDCLSAVLARNKCSTHYAAWHRAENREKYNANARARYRKDPEKARETQRDFRTRDPERQREYQREYARKHPERVRGYLRKHRLKAAYGLSQEQYDQMLAEQNGCCAICKSCTPYGKKNTHFHVDHCHETGAIRGLLCSKCNTALGLFCDDAVVLKRAIDYLRK